ncbi:MAG TPA: phosphatase PAP2 family protein [Gemmataceae bacterium]|nr:phosphatase PAP2 family protein [Gemmataceae bacterium]
MESVQAADEGTLFWFENHHSLVGDKIMKVITHVGDPKAVIAVVAVAVILFFLAGRRRTALVMLLASLLGLGIAQSMKYVVKRERPDVAWRLVTRPHTPSFPSGHSLNSMAIYGSLALLAARHARRRLLAGLILAAGFAVPLAIGFSRPYLGVHYPTDVLAGWTAGLACAMLALWADQRWGDRELFAPPVTPLAAPQPLSPSTAGSEGIRRAGEITGVRGP